MSTYTRKSLIDNRYHLLATSSIYTYDDENLTSYADFLKKFGRFLSKDGFVDSEGTIKRSNRRDRSKEPDTAPVRRSNSDGGDTRRRQQPEQLNSVYVAVAETERAKANEKHLKVIEDQVIQSKQAERALKRKEGDVKKEQRRVRQAVREFDTTMSKRRLEADKNLAKNLEERKTLEVENAHKNEKKTKERTEQSLEFLSNVKDKGRKTLLVCNDLSRQYQLKMSELDLKEKELTVLQSDYENKIRRKEEEEARVKKELAEIALALNMETIKAKNDLHDFKRIMEKNKDTQIKKDLNDSAELEGNLNKTNNYVKNYDMTRRRLSLETDQEKSQWSMKQREANRRIVDTRNNLERIYEKQRNLNNAAQIADLEKKQHEIDKKIQDVSTRRAQLQNNQLSERKEKNQEHETMFKARASHRLTELQLKDHEDNLKHFQRLVQKGDEQEKDLYKTVKEAEFQRRKKDNELKRLQDEYIELKKANSVKIKELIANALAQEKDIEQKILKEKAVLKKHNAEKEDSYLKLISHRERAKEDKFLLENHEKEHNRLLRLLGKNKLDVKQKT